MSTTVVEEHQANWARVRAQMRDEVGAAAFESWLKPLTLLGVNEGVVTMSVTTRFIRDWIRQHYVERLYELWRREDPEIGSVDILVLPRGARAVPAGARTAFDVTRPFDKTARNGRSENEGAPGEDGETRSEAQPPVPLDPRLTFDNFVVGRPNEFAYATARRVAESDVVQYNPLFIHGGVGLGKTHLMHAIAWHIRGHRPDRQVIYISAEKFMNQLIRAIRYKDMMAFKERFRSVDVLMIDDVQFFAGKDSTQEEFFHTFNALVDQNHQVVVSADKSPSDLSGLQERLRSRMGWGLVADIHPTNYELRLGILQAKAEAFGVRVEPNVLEFLAHRITSNVRDLEGALNRIIHHSSFIGRPVNLDESTELLRDLLRANDRRITIEDIQKTVASHFNVKVSDMHSARRARAVARPRQVAMFLAKQLTARSLPEIGRRFGGRDHTTVMHAVRRIEELCSTDPSFGEDVELLRRMLER